MGGKSVIKNNQGTKGVDATGFKKEPTPVKKSAPAKPAKKSPFAKAFFGSR